jgi:oxygen-independent coproporphyrinogen III oxidase
MSSTSESVKPAALGAGELDFAALEALLLRYSGAGPRYTSYPTAPVWTEAYGRGDYARDLRALGAKREPISIYVHVPFCRSLCHFCACNRTITRDARLPERFLDAIRSEIAAVREAAGAPLAALQHHWGGGTPTHLEPAQILRLFASVNEAFPAAPSAEISIEIDPRVTTRAQLEALRACGFSRLSLGVQDFDARVQRAIHREQTVALTAGIVAEARALGFAGVSFDLIYGLPFQTRASFERTLGEVIAIGPDRIALYGYAHVTWIAKQQRGFERGDLPAPSDRLAILVSAIRQLLAAGYVHVGMDHFARPEDPLAVALRERTLRRNFMGYTTQAGLALVGFGPSAISELPASYAQSQRELADWEAAVEAHGLATFRGHALTPDDVARRAIIQQLMCLGEVRAADHETRGAAPFRERFARELERLRPLEEDGLAALAPDGSVRVTERGRLVLRNLAMVFDAYLGEQPTAADRPRFSQTV